MTDSPSFERSVFINCPFDSNFTATLQAIAFTVVTLGFIPRIAPENADNGAARLDRILDIVKGSKYGIHDLSRCKATSPGEYARLNMPFELGLDHAAALFGDEQQRSKSILVLEETRYDYQKSLSDIAGWDIEAHDGNYEKTVQKVTRWLRFHAGGEAIGPTRVLNQYVDFQDWYWKQERATGASDNDIRDYPTVDVINAMLQWAALGRPTG